MDKDQIKHLINEWFVDHFYNRGLDTEAFNHAQQGRADLMNRIDDAFAAEAPKED